MTELKKMNISVLTIFFLLIGISVLIPSVLASSSSSSDDGRPDAYSEWDKTSTFTTTGTAIARVVDQYMNMDSNKVETLTADIYTEKNEDSPELKVTLTETNVDTGIFEGTIFFSETEESFGNTLQVKDGDVVSIEYTYSQVPGSDKLEDMIGVGQEKTIQNSQRESGINNVGEEGEGVGVGVGGGGVDKDDTNNTNFVSDTPNSLEPSVTLDREVYPVPFGTPQDFVSEIYVDSDTPDGRSMFPIHLTGMNGVGISDKTFGIDSGEFISSGDLVIHLQITDHDLNSFSDKIDLISKNVEDENGLPVGPVKISIVRDSDDVVVLGYAGGNIISNTQDKSGLLDVGDNNPKNARHLGSISETAPDSGIFEFDLQIRYTDGPAHEKCPETTVYSGLSDANIDGDLDDQTDRFDESNQNHYCIMQGDILKVEYTVIDESGHKNTITDAATFDLRNGVLESDRAVYIIGDYMTLTLIDDDLNLDSQQIEEYDLDLIEWDSAAATVTMGDADGQISLLDPEPAIFRETGNDTGVFEIQVDIPSKLQDESLERGEEIVLEYTDWSPSGADFVGQEDEDINLTVFTSNFGATVELDKKRDYTWGDTVHITIVSPNHNFDADLVDELGYAEPYTVKIATQNSELENYKLVETGTDTGIFTGQVILIDPESGQTTQGNGPTNGMIETGSDDAITIAFEFSENETVVGSALIKAKLGQDKTIDNSKTSKQKTNHDVTDEMDTKKKKYMSPLQQAKQGITVNEITCKNNMVLAIKHDGTPACVKSSTLSNLTKRGWIGANNNNSDVTSDIIANNALDEQHETLKATVDLDQKIYTWTDMVYITVVAPDYNLNDGQIDEIGNSDDTAIKITTKSATLDNYVLTETGLDTGVFTGEVILTGFLHDADGNPITGDKNGNDVTGQGPRGNGPEDGLLPVDDNDGINVLLALPNDEHIVGSALINWNKGQIKWLESSYSGESTGVVQVVDPDMNLDPKAVDNFDVVVWSDTDLAGIDLTVTETNKSTGLFEGTIFFSAADESSGHRLRVSNGDTLVAIYEDHTLPDPHTTADELDIIDTATIHDIDTLVDDVKNRIELDKKSYTWTDKVYITLHAPEHNLDGNLVEYIGSSQEHPIKISTSSFDLDNYRLVETGPDSGLFVGEVVLTGNPYHDADGDGNDGDASGISSHETDNKEILGPRDGLLPVYGKDTGLTISFEYAEDKTALVSVPLTWNTGTVQWLEPSYYLGNIGNVMVTDPDMNLNPEEKDTVVIDVWSDSDAGGVDIVLTETGVETGVFKGMVVFTDEESSGHQLRVTAGDTVIAEYEDNTLPSPHSSADEIDIVAETVIN